jgi:tRNA 2-thiouridine synthesizing protein A
MVHCARSLLLNPDKRIDCTGLFCPMPVVKTREAIRTLSVGQVLEMLSDDPGSEPDMKGWARRAGHELMDISREGATYRFLVRKAH